MQTTLSPATRAAIETRHADLLRLAGARRLRGPLAVLLLLLYFAASWWFFSIGTVLGKANWGIAGNYLAGWVSYEVRPEFRLPGDGSLTLSYGRNSPLGANPDPDWVTLETAERSAPVDPPAAAAASPAAPAGLSSFMAAENVAPATVAPTQAPAKQPEKSRIVTAATVRLSSSASVALRPDRVTVERGDERLDIRLAGENAIPLAPLPAWASQKRPGDKVIVRLGLAGWAEIGGDRVTVRKRFLGWANFLFDTRSPFFGKPAGEVIGLIVSGARIDPARSNLALAFDNICYNAEWQHLDVWTKLLQTIVMAFVGTLFAAILAFPLAFFAARNITASGVVNQLTKRLFDFLRSVDMLIWALFFTRAFGPGPLAGMAAIFFTDTGTLGKLYAEALENLDDRQREGVRSVGASPAAVQRYGVLPQVLPVFASQALYFWESNTRSATIIGAVGAGGIGLKLWEAIRTNSNWGNVAYMVLLLLIVVFLFDAISNALRSRLIRQGRA